jgi:GPH family glycoside/pentoside/hexuronide:cation symporter
MITYSLGECSNSLVMNSLNGFAMLYYTDALNLKHSLAGLGLFLAIFWDAITDPVMGHITDNTRSRFGKRHPYLLAGGIVMVVSFYFLWYVPDYFIAGNLRLFWYLVIMNMIMRTGFTVFAVPYTALGFEICTDYYGRTKLQGIRNAMNMAANFAGPALAWRIFFNNNMQTRATNVAENYLRMGTVFTIAASFFVIAVILFTLKYIKDSRRIRRTGTSIKAFFVDMYEIVTDIYPRWVFLFMFVVILGIALVSALQMYLYEHFMVLTGFQKTVTHGGSMLGMGLGALLSSFFVRKLDKKGAVCFAVLWGTFCNLLLAAVFLTGLLKPQQTIGAFPVSFVIFAFFHANFWLSNGVMLPVAMSMMADVSEVNEIKTGINKDGGYAAVFSFAMKCSFAVAALGSGYILTFIGFEAKKDIQTQQAVWNLCASTLLLGPAISVTALLLILKYPLNSDKLEELRGSHNQADTQ